MKWLIPSIKVYMAKFIRDFQLFRNYREGTANDKNITQTNNMKLMATSIFHISNQQKK